MQEYLDFGRGLVSVQTQFLTQDPVFAELRRLNLDRKKLEQMRMEMASVRTSSVQKLALLIKIY